MVTLSRQPTEPTFWRDDTLPFVEARSIADGRKVRYGKHAHEAFSIGIVTSGRCSYLNGRTQQKIGAGTVVLMNPGDAHACNPERGGSWSYRMLYFDVAWLAGIQQDLGCRKGATRIAGASRTFGAGLSVEQAVSPPSGHGRLPCVHMGELSGPRLADYLRSIDRD